MTFDEELRQIISGAWADQEKADAKASSFTDQWSSLKGTVIKVFDATVAILHQHRFQGDRECRNGSVLLKVKGQSDKDWRHWLSFKPDDSAHVILCGSSIEELAENFDKLEREGVELKVKQFLVLALKR